MKTIRIKPARDGLIVLDPVSRQALPADFTEKPDNVHWRRQLRAGDVVQAPPAAAAKPAARPAVKES